MLLLIALLTLLSVLLASVAHVLAAPPPFQADVGALGTLGNMPSAILVACGALAAVIVQYVKFSGLPDGYGPFAVVVIAFLIVGLWAFGELNMNHPLGSPLGYLFDVVNIVVSAAGTYGFVRAINPASVTTTNKPPPGAFQGPTTGP